MDPRTLTSFVGADLNLSPDHPNAEGACAHTKRTHSQKIPVLHPSRGLLGDIPQWNKR